MQLTSIFTGLFDTTTTTSVSITSFIICIAVSLILGLIIAYAYTFKDEHSKSFVATLVTLPAIVAMIILMVNGNIGTGVAVAGTFSLVRFRSAPGTAKEIGALFLAMGTGLTAGMGYLGFAALFVIIILVATYILDNTNFGEEKSNKRGLRITMPEDLDYTNIFDDIFETYTKSYSLENVKTISMGSLFKLSYNIVLKEESNEKDMIDEIRIRNGNLEVQISKKANLNSEL